MIVLEKSSIRRFALVALIVLLAAATIVSITLAGDQSFGFTFVTAPIITDLDLYLETNGNGIHDAEEFVGVFDVYDGNSDLTFSWTPFEFPADVNGSYRISLWQNTNPLGDPVWVETKVAHHWANNPNGATFTMGAFGFGEEICTTCPSIIVVAPEVYTLVEGAEGYTYKYTSLVAAHYTHANGNLGIPESEEFIIQIFRPAPDDTCVPDPDVISCTCRWDIIPTGIVFPYQCVDSCGEEAPKGNIIGCVKLPG